MFNVYRFVAVSLFLTQLFFCVDDGVILWLKIKNPTATTSFQIGVRVTVVEGAKIHQECERK